MSGGPVTCQRCGMPDPPPEQSCDEDLDHFVGTERGCHGCGRLVRACVLRPCQARRAETRAVLDALEDDGE